MTYYSIPTCHCAMRHAGPCPESAVFRASADPAPPVTGRISFERAALPSDALTGSKEWWERHDALFTAMKDAKVTIENAQPYIEYDGPIAAAPAPFPSEWEVSTILKAAADLCDRKRRDYAGEDSDSNFTSSAAFAARVCRGLPDNDRRRSTATLIGIKLARLDTLGLAGNALNESLDDTLRDIINYVALLLRQQMRARAEK